MNSVLLFLLGWIMLEGSTRLAGAGETGQENIVRTAQKKEVTLDWLLDQPSLFAATLEDFEKQYPKGTFAWLDKEKTRARFNPDRVDLKLRGSESGETIVSFKEARISGVMISVMNKGDDGYIKEIPFKKAISTATAMLKAVAKVAESPRKKNETVSKADGLVWSTKQALYMLEYLWVQDEERDGGIWLQHGEFVRIRILPPQILMGSQQNTLKTNISWPTLAKRVKKEGSKVWLEGIPMVDQGSKGYCAVASFERVMRYYGSQVDMHDLADLANANAFGTSPPAMKEAVHKMAVRSGLRTREPIFMEGKDFDLLIKAYNREVKKLKTGEELSGIRSVGLMYQKMDPAIFKAVRTKEAGFSKFGSEIARSINAGVPVMWALQLGMFWEEGLEDSYEANRATDGSATDPDPAAGGEAAEPRTEPEPPATRPARPPASMAGGHMRLIIGYDPKARLILYTDSWGPGHEMKQMSLEEAYTVTMALFMIEP